MKAQEQSSTGQLRCKARIIQQGWLGDANLQVGDVIQVDKQGIHEALSEVWRIDDARVHSETWAWSNPSPKKCPVIRLIAGTLEPASDEHSSIAGTLEGE